MVRVQFISFHAGCFAKGVPSPSECIFPFKYKGIEYPSCTLADSENGKAWCAYQVQPGKTTDVYIEFTGTSVFENRLQIAIANVPPKMLCLMAFFHKLKVFNFQGK